MTEPVLTEIDEGVATLTLNRPRVHNAFDDVLVEALSEALKSVESERAVRAVVLTGDVSAVEYALKQVTRTLGEMMQFTTCTITRT